jgi:hypothetical protein
MIWLHKTVAVAACLGAALISTTSASTINWTNSAGGNWNLAANWNPNQVPGNSDDAVITNAGAYTVTLDTSPTVGSLTLGGSSGQQTLSTTTAGYTLTLNSNSVVNPNGVLALSGGTLNDNGGLTVNGQIAWTGGMLGMANVPLNIGTNGSLVLAGNSGGAYNLGQPLGNAGTVQLVSGNLQLHDGYYGILTNLPGGVVELTADNVSIVQYGVGPGFDNEGTLVKSGGTGTSSISVTPFNNSGTVEANTGTINLNSTVANFYSGSLFIGAGQTVLSGGTITFNGSLTSSNLVLNGAVLQGNGVLNGVLTWISGVLGTQNETLTIATNSVLVLAGSSGGTYNLGQPLNNEGTVYLQSGNLQLHDGYYGILTNSPGGVVDLAADVSIIQYGNGPGFINEGTLVKSGGTGTSSISADPFNNSGTIEVNTGTISLNTTANLYSGSLFIGAGQAVLSGGTTTFNGSLTSSNLVLNGAVLQGNGVLNGVLTWISGVLGTQNEMLTIATNSVLVLAGSSGGTYNLGQPLNNEGMVYLQSGNLQLHDGYYGILTNSPGGVVDFAADVSIIQYGTGPGFVNEGTLLKSGRTNTSTISSTFNNNGIVAVNIGTININGTVTTLTTGSQFIGTGQTVFSGATVNLNGDVTFSNAVLAGATLEGNGVLYGVLTWTSGILGTMQTTLTIATNAALVLAGADGSTYNLGQPLNNEGTVYLQSGNLQLHDGYYGILTNSPGGVVDLAGDVSIIQYGNGPGFINEGTLLESGGNNTNTISSAFSNNGGSVSVESGTLSFSGNNFVQGGGTFSINLGGTNPGQSGALIGVSSATLSGLLTVTLTNGFVPALGSTFHLLSSSSLGGTLAPLNIPAGLSVSYSNSGVYLTVTSTVALAPAITVQPTNETVPYAGSTVFSVAATGLTPLSYQWLQNGTVLSDGGTISGSASPSLALNGVTDNNAGNYSVIITNAYGSVTSLVVTLTVLNCTTPPSGLVSWWPGNGNALDIISGNNGVLSNGVAFAPGEVGQAFNFNGNGNNQSVVIPDSSSLELTNTFTIEAWVNLATLTDDPNGNGRGIVSKVGGAGGNNGYQFAFGGHNLGGQFNSPGQPWPQWQVYTPISTLATGAWMHVAFTYDQNTMLLYLNGQPIATNVIGPHQIATSSSNLRISGDDNGNVMFDGLIDEVSIYNRALSPNEIAAVYGAGAAGKCLSEGPAIAGQPQSQSVVLGGTAMFGVTATGLLPLTNQWQLDGTNLTDNGRITGSQSNVLVITNVQFTDAGTYLVSVSNMVGGVVSQPATLVVLRKTPVVTWSNAAPISYGAALNDAQLNATSNVPGNFAYDPPGGTVLNAGSYLLSLVFTPADTVDYNSVTQYVSLTVSTAPLTVTAHNASRAYGQVNPAFTGTIAGLQGLDNITADYSCAAVPASPPGGYPIVPSLVDPYGRLINYSVALTNGILQVNAAAPPAISAVLPVTGSTNGSQTVTLTGTNFETGASVSFGSALATGVNVSSPTLLTLLTPASAPGIVNVTIHNPDSNQATLTNAFTFGIPPSIQVQPSSQSVVLNSNVQFQVQASGQGTLSYQWQFNGANLLNLGGISGVQTPTLNISNLVTADGGSYQVVIANTYGTLVSTSAVLTVLTPPSVTTPPSVAAGVGGSASFSVTAGGTSPFGYQWYQGTSPVAGATGPTLNFASVQTTNQGQYSVVVTNVVGSVTSTPAMLTVLGYCASAQIAQSLYPAGTTIPFTVNTYNCGTQAAQSNSAAVLWIYNSGTTRTIPCTTGAGGNVTANFTPLFGEVGLVQYAAALPGVNNPAAQGSFTLVGMEASPASATPVLTVGYAQTNTITLSNLTSIALSGLAASVSGPPGNVSVQISVPGSLPGNRTVQATYILEATGSIPNQAQFNLQFTTSEGVTNNFPINATIVELEPQIVAIPAALHGTMVPGSQSLVTFGLENVGGTDSGSLQILLPPDAPWLSVVTAQPLASLTPGQSNLVTLALTPTNGLTLGAYSGSLIIAGQDFQSSVPFTFDAVSTQVGSLQVTAQDEFTLVSPGAPNLSNATVTVSDFLTGSNVATLVTGAAGTVIFTNLTSAYYTIDVQATNHGGFDTTLLVQPNETNDVTAFLPDNLVSYTWVVTPTTIPDNYDFVLTTTFQTQVPWPVVTINPGAINLCQFGGTNQVDLVISNNGLISAQGLVLSFGTNTDWSIVPLANNLGDLPAESSIVVPVVITQLGSSTSAASSIAAQLNWHVFTPTQTNYYTTPIYVYNANPNNCIISSTPVVNVSGGGGGGDGGGGEGGSGGGSGVVQATPFVASPSYSFAPPVTGAIVDVTLQIDQHAVIARDAFKATLQINNTAGAAISDLKVTINPVDASGNAASNLFEVVPPTLTGLNAVDGTGSLNNGASGTASWTIIPDTNAAPTGPTQFAIGGTLSYVLDGQQVVIPLFAVPITVLPSPILNVDYFLEHDVYSQDPFTSQVEPSVPFGLGIMVHNKGLGLADDFTITSAQPRIIANSNGLLIAFELIGSQAGTNLLPSPSLTMDLGAIPPGGDATGIWLMTSTLEGAFISYSATFQHVDALGATNTSLVNSVAIHEMNHIVRITVPEDDGIPDFLVNDTTNVDALPDNVYSSAGPVFQVTSLTNVTVTGTLSGTQSNITATVSTPPGWVYIEFPDPSDGTMTIGSVQRSDGVNLLVGPNVWQTPQRVHMLPPQPQALVHLFDYNSTGSYKITYGPMVTTPTVTTLTGVTTNPVSATLNALVNPNNGSTTVYFEWGTTTNYTGITPQISLTQSLNTPQAAAIPLVGLQPDTTYHYQAVAENSAGTSFGGDVTFTTPLVSPPVIAQVAYVSMAVGQNLVITNQANTQVTFSLDPVDPAGATINTNGIFRWTPACDQGSSTNIITIWATDTQYPTVSNFMTFLVTVGDCVEVGVGSAALVSGQEACVPVNLISSSVPLNNVQFTLQFPTDQVSNLSISSTNLAVGAAIIESSSPAQAQFSVSALSGRLLQGPANIAEVCFQASDAHSTFVPLTMTGVQGTKSNGTLVGNSSGGSGQLAVVAAEPLLQAGLQTNAAFVLTLYGIPGSNYVIQSSSALNGTWQSNLSMTLSNVANPIIIGGASSNPPIQFYRAYKQ